MTSTPTITRFWLDPRSGQYYRATNHAHWLVQNATMFGLEEKMTGLEHQRDESAIHSIGVGAGLVRMTRNGTTLLMTYHAGAEEIEQVMQAVRDFLRQEILPPVHRLHIRNSLFGNERSLSIEEFFDILDYGSQLFPRISPAGRKLLGLVICHLALGFVLAMAFEGVRGNYGDFMFIALISAEVALLAVWVSMIRQLEWQRLLGAITAMTYLWCLANGTVPNHDFEYFVAVFSAIFFLVLFVMGALRFTRLQALHVNQIAVNAKLVPLQFSIRQLMVLTAALAVLFALMRYFSSSDPGLTGVQYAPVLSIPPLLSVWSTLSMGSPRMRIPIVLALSVASGAIPAILYPHMPPVGLWPSVSLAEAMIAIASLLVVRSCGYRLLRLANPTE